jgi:very-short-patch-repair endonuclease
MGKHFPSQNSRLRGKLRTAARELRHIPTPAEDMLWWRLRGRQLSGYKFHRQYAIDRFITDFYCAKSGLVIELDGEIHQQQIEADEEREQILTALGFRVIRFKNDQVLCQTDQVLQRILDTLEGTPSPKSGFDDFGEGDGG